MSSHIPVFFLCSSHSCSFLFCSQRQSNSDPLFMRKKKKIFSSGAFYPQDILFIVGGFLLWKYSLKFLSPLFSNLYILYLRLYSLTLTYFLFCSPFCSNQSDLLAVPIVALAFPHAGLSPPSSVSAHQNITCLTCWSTVSEQDSMVK